MANIIRTSLYIYLFYIHLGGFLPFRINFKELSLHRSRPWLIYSVIYGMSFVFSQFKLYYTMSEISWEYVSFRNLRVLTIALSYVSVLVMTTSIMVHHVLNHERLFTLSSRVFEIIHQMRKFNLNSCAKAQQLRSGLLRAFFVKVLYFETLSALLFVDRDYSWTTASMADLGVKSNLWLINIMTSLYVGVFLVIIYHFNILSLRVVAISEELRYTQSLKRRHKQSSATASSLPLPSVDLSFRYCDDIDEISSLHQTLRRLAQQVQRLFQPLLLLTFIYHWCDFIIQAYLWYITYTAQGAFRLLTVLHYLTAILMALVDMVFLCAVAHETSNAAAETGLALQKFNAFDVDQRLERTVSAGCLSGTREEEGGIVSQEEEDKVMTVRGMGLNFSCSNSFPVAHSWKHFRWTYCRTDWICTSTGCSPWTTPLFTRYVEICIRLSSIDWSLAICLLLVFSHQLIHIDHPDSIRDVHEELMRPRDHL